MTNITLPKLNQTGTNEWADVEDNDVAMRDVINASLDTANFSAVAAIVLSQLSTTARQTIGTDRGYAEVLAEESTNSSGWTDLGPLRFPEVAGPLVTVSTVAGGVVVCVVSCEMKGKFVTAQLGVEVSTDHVLSGTPVEPEILLSTSLTAFTDNPFTAVAAFGVTGGSRTVVLKYAADPSTDSATFKNRKLWVIAFGGF
ncbi:MAG: hypothetical protein ACRDLD_02465 [Thermoleophilaceae bacterium]